MHSQTLHCQECGFDYPPDSPGAHCPRCLLDLALDDDSRQENFFAGYEVYEEVARGGMGIVYRARQIDPPRQVALKRLQAGAMATAEARMRFELEIGAVARLSHPNIVSLCESGEESGELFFSMTYLPGGSLADRLKEEPDPPNLTILRKRVKLLVSVCDAVHHAHQRGILHRDLKPSNILFNEEGEPIVTDFGLVKMLEADSNLTLSQAFIGSPNYMAPEQASGGASGATTSADVYGLGSILYALATGRPPFEADTPMETMRMVADQPPKSPRKLNNAVGSDLERVCLKCLEKSPAQRYASTGELASDLRRWLEHRPVRARTRPTLAQAWLWCRRHPGAATAIAATAILLTSISIISAVSAYRIEAANERTADLLTRMRIEKAEALFEDDRTNEGLCMLSHVLKTLAK